MVDAIDEIGRASGTFPMDVHSGNWGTRADGSLALFDFGAAMGKGKPQRIRQLAIVSDRPTLAQALGVLASASLIVGLLRGMRRD